MAVTGRRTNNMWTNNDGLLVAFGPAEASATNAGNYRHVGDRHHVEFIIHLEELPSSTDHMILDDSVTIPNGAFIEQVDVIVIEEPTTSGSGAPNLDLGLVDQDRSTELDFDGLLADADAFETGTDLGRQVSYVLGTTEAGALIGTVLTNTGLVCANYDTNAWLDGVLKVKIYYSIPLSTDL